MFTPDGDMLDAAVLDSRATGTAFGRFDVWPAAALFLGAGGKTPLLNLGGGGNVAFPLPEETEEADAAAGGDFFNAVAVMAADGFAASAAEVLSEVTVALPAIEGLRDAASASKAGGGFRRPCLGKTGSVT
jgi:hypothetical protein